MLNEMESERETREDEAPTKALVINRYMHLEVHMEITFVLQHTVNPMVEVLVVLLMGVLLDFPFQRLIYKQILTEGDQVRAELLPLEKKQTHAPYFQE